MLTFEQATKKLGERAQKGLGKRATVLRRVDENTIAVRYHATDVVTLFADGTYRLDSGGYKTVTTKSRINEYGPCWVSQRDYCWFVGARPYGNGEVPFVDGMVVGPNGETKNAPADLGAVSKRRSALDRKVKKYIDGFCSKVEHDRKLPEPEMGDCLACSMRTEDRTAEAMGFDHYVSHLDEQYYMGSLIRNAIADYGSPPVIWALMEKEAWAGKSDWLRRSLVRFFRRLKPKLAELEAVNA